jgi:hypothetical protein
MKDHFVGPRVGCQNDVQGVVEGQRLTLRSSGQLLDEAQLLPLQIMAAVHVSVAPVSTAINRPDFLLVKRRRYR